MRWWALSHDVIRDVCVSWSRFTISRRRVFFHPPSPPPPRPLRHLQDHQPDASEHDTRRNRHGPADPDLIHNRQHSSRPARSHQASQQIQRRRRARAFLGEDIHQKSIHYGDDTRRRPPQHERTNNRHGDVRLVLQRPPKNQHRANLQPRPHPQRAQARALQGKIIWVAGEAVLEIGIIVIQKPPRRQRADDTPSPVPDVREPDLNLREAVGAREQRGEHRDGHLPDGVVDAQEQDREGHFAGEDDLDRAEDVDGQGARPQHGRCGGRAFQLRTLGTATRLDMGEQRVRQPPSRLRPVAYHAPKRFGQDDHQDAEEDAPVDGEEPEDGAPAERLREDAAEDGSDCHGGEEPRLEYPHVASSLFARGDVAYHARADGDRARAACALQAPQDHELVVMLRFGQPNARADEDEKGADVGYAAAFDVCYGTPYGGRQALQDHVGCHGEVDELGCDTQVKGDGRDGGEVDVGGEAGERRCDGDERYDEGFLGAGEDAVWYWHLCCRSCGGVMVGEDSFVGLTSAVFVDTGMLLILSHSVENELCPWQYS